LQHSSLVEGIWGLCDEEAPLHLLGGGGAAGCALAHCVSWHQGPKRRSWQEARCAQEAGEQQQCKMMAKEVEVEQ